LTVVQSLRLQQRSVLQFLGAQSTPIGQASKAQHS
jgi:hypothetical protein